MFFGASGASKALRKMIFYMFRDRAIPLNCCRHPDLMVLGQQLSLSRTKLEIDPTKSIKGWTMSSELEFQPTPRSNDWRGQPNQTLAYRAYISSLGRMPNRGPFSQKPTLAQKAQGIASKSRERQHQGIGGAFSRGEAFQVQIRCDLTGQRLTKTPIFIQGDHMFFIKGKGRPPALQCQTELKKHRPLRVRYPLCHPNDQPECIGLPVVSSRKPWAENRRPLSGSRWGETTLSTGLISPMPNVCPTQITCDDEIDLGVSTKIHKGFQGIMRRFGSHQEGFMGHLSGTLQHLEKKASTFLLGMLAAFPKLNAQAPVSTPQLKADECVAVLTLIRQRDPFFFGGGSDQRENVQIQGQVTGGERFSGNASLLKQLCAAFSNIVRENFQGPVKALSQGLLRKYPSKSRILLEPVIVQDTCGGFTIACPHPQKPQIGLHHLRTENLRLPRHMLFQPFVQARVTADQVPYQNSIRVGAVEGFPGLFDVEFLHVRTCRVKKLKEPLCHKIHTKHISSSAQDVCG